MEKLNNSSKFNVIFRCDAAKIPEIGTGHLYRCIGIANYLNKKFYIKKKKICFLIKTSNKFYIGFRILKKYNFQIIKLDTKLKNYSKKESIILSKFKSKLLIIDRLGKVNLNFLRKIRKNYIKKVIIDDNSNYRHFFDLSLNPLIRNVKKKKNSKIGFRYLLLSAKKIKRSKVNKNNIFLFFGGFDKNNFANKILILLNQINYKLNIYVHENYKKKINKKNSNHKIFYFNSNNYYKKLHSSNLVFNSGGMGLFDSILFNKKIICLPQYKHQEINAKEIAKLGGINLFKNLNKTNKYKIINTFFNIYDNRKYEKKITFIQKKIINFKMIKENYSLIGKVYEKSKN